MHAGMLIGQLTMHMFQWHKDLNEKVMLANEQPVPCFLFANKASLCL